MTKWNVTDQPGCTDGARNLLGRRKGSAGDRARAVGMTVVQAGYMGDELDFRQRCPGTRTEKQKCWAGARTRFARDGACSRW